MFKNRNFTTKEALTKLMLEHNNYQEYRQSKNKTYSYIDKQQMTAFAKTLKPEELKTLTKTYAYQKRMLEKLYYHLQQERKLNNIYGKEDVHFMELTDEERELINKRRAKENK